MKIAGSMKKIIDQLNSKLKFEPHVRGVKQIGIDALYAAKVIVPKLAVTGAVYEGTKRYFQTENYDPFEQGIEVIDKSLTGAVNGAKIGLGVAITSALFVRYPLPVCGGVAGAIAADEIFKQSKRR